MIDHAHTIRIQDASEIISGALQQSRQATGKLDQHYAMAVMAGDILRLRAALEDCVKLVESSLCCDSARDEPEIQAAKRLLNGF